MKKEENKIETYGTPLVRQAITNDSLEALRNRGDGIKLFQTDHTAIIGIGGDDIAAALREMIKLKPAK